jgi:hypothetical protein
MSVPIRVDAYSGYRANERPRQFSVDEDIFEIVSVEDRWYDPEAEYFKVRTTDGKRFLLRCSSDCKWTLESAFDGIEFPGRPGITLVNVDTRSIREAESWIAGCERCGQNNRSGSSIRFWRMCWNGMAHLNSS